MLGSVDEGLFEPAGPIVATSLAFGLFVSLAWLAAIGWSDAEGWQAGVASGAFILIYVLAPFSVVSQYIIGGTVGRVLEMLDVPGSDALALVLIFCAPGVIQGFVWCCLLRLGFRSWEARRT